ncbi:MscS family mechanosensitive ion channel [hydrothermal vent metagenome]|uniref:MscS family mechanosensitive ion channel n=1 Tax=hydrothermal vent metagenome TaxID=652676 RepID=A0A1W1BAZ5_9ZZZZ
MNKIIYFVLSLSMLFGAVETNTSSSSPLAFSSSKENMIELLRIRKEQLDKVISKDNIWSKIYSNYKTYMFLKKESDVTKAKISLLKKRRHLTPKQKDILEKYIADEQTINSKLQLLTEYENNPFQKLVKPEDIEEVPSVTNPFAILSALSFLKTLNSQLEDYTDRYNSLNNIIESFKEETYILKELIRDVKDNAQYKQRLEDIVNRLKTYKPVLEIFKTTLNVYNKKIDEIKLQVRKDIKREIEKSASIGGVVLFFLLFFLLGKFLVRKYMEDNDRYYTINKVMNITFITFFVLTLLFGYIENVSYLVTVLGFASAGIAIAMKDWFMSVMGWFVIMIGGSIHVGDRVKFVRGNVEYIGDIVDISILRMTLHEDVTLTTYMHNRRSGRMIFIPNNFIFTDMIANYSHAGLKTVWDGIDFVVTFDSDINKASSIAKEVTKQYSKGYTDITRKQLNKLRSSYSIRNTNVEPRILTLIDENGIRISSWYLTNAYATMTLRSTISLEIITRIQAEESVKLAFPTQSIYVDKSAPKPTPPADLNNGIV